MVSVNIRRKRIANVEYARKRDVVIETIRRDSHPARSRAGKLVGVFRVGISYPLLGERGTVGEREIVAERGVRPSTPFPKSTDVEKTDGPVGSPGEKTIPFAERGAYIFCHPVDPFGPPRSSLPSLLQGVISSGLRGTDLGPSRPQHLREAGRSPGQETEELLPPSPGLHGERDLRGDRRHRRVSVPVPQPSMELLHLGRHGTPGGSGSRRHHRTRRRFLVRPRAKR